MFRPIFFKTCAVFTAASAGTMSLNSAHQKSVERCKRLEKDVKNSYPNCHVAWESQVNGSMEGSTIVHELVVRRPRLSNSVPNSPQSESTDSVNSPALSLEKDFQVVARFR